MKSYYNIEGWDIDNLPLVKAWREGAVTRIMHEITYEPEHQEGEVTIPAQISAYAVDVKGDSSYSAIVSAIVRSEYSADAVEALTANYLKASDPNSDLDNAKRIKYLKEHSAYQMWREIAKDVATEVTQLLNQ